jgi:hypothetical protein
MMKVQINGRGRVLLQVLDQESRWGFYLTDGESIWDGGFGFGSRVQIVPTRRKCPRLDGVARAIASGQAFPEFSRSELVYLY